MYITIAGGGTIGRSLALRLIESKHDVVIIEQDKAICEAIYAESGAVTINGNATNLDVLEHAGIEKSDVAVAAMRHDSDNLTFAILAKSFKIPHVHVRMTDPKYEGVYKTVGVDNIARASSLLVDQFLVNIETPEIRKVIGLGNLDIVITNVPDASQIHGMTVREFTQEKSFPKSVRIACIYNESSDAFEVPWGESVIQERDRLFLCGTIKDINGVVKICPEPPSRIRECRSRTV